MKVADHCSKQEWALGEGVLSESGERDSRLLSAYAQYVPLQLTTDST